MLRFSMSSDKKMLKVKLHNQYHRFVALRVFVYMNENTLVKRNFLRLHMRHQVAHFNACINEHVYLLVIAWKNHFSAVTYDLFTIFMFIQKLHSHKI